MTISTTNSPTRVLRGNPASDAHQPVPSELVAFLDEVLANGASSTDLTAEAARIDALEAIGATGAQYTSGGPVACATTANITLSGEQTIDGVTTSADRVLVIAQTDPAENGIYVSAAGAWARATDMDAAAEVNGTLVFVQAGTANGLTTFVTYSAVETLGADDIVWREADDASAFSAALALKASAADPAFTGDVDMSGADSVPVPTPTEDTHAATKAYVDDAVDGIDAAPTEAARLAEIAASVGGLFVDISLCQCFQEASISATTRATYGDDVGMIVALDGTWRMVAKSTGERGVLRVNSVGRPYLDTTDAAFVVFDTAGGYFDPTSVFDITVGFQGVGRVATWRSGLTNTTGNYLRTTDRGIRCVGSAGSDITTSVPEYFGFPNTIRMKRGVGVETYYTQGRETDVGSIVPFDDSAATRRAGFFTSDTRPVSAAALDGQFYGVFWVPGSIPDEIARRVQDYMTAATLPNHPIRTDRRSVVLDFHGDLFSWDRSDRLLSDLTDNGSDSYTLNYMDWWWPDRTYILDFELTGAEPGDTESVIQMVSENSAEETIYYRPSFGLSHSMTNETQTLGGDQATAIPSAPFGPNGRTRFAIRITEGQSVEVIRHDGVVVHDSSGAKPVRIMQKPTGMIINTATVSTTVRRVSLYNSALTDEDLNAAFRDAGTTDIHFLGDSFVAQSLAEHFDDYFANEGFTDIFWTEDGAGGHGFYEPSGGGHAQRYARMPGVWDRILLICDGGLEDRSEAEFRSAIMQITSEAYSIDEDGYVTSGRVLMIEPNPINDGPSSKRDGWEVRNGWLKSAFINENLSGSAIDLFVHTLEAMWCAYDSFGADAGEIAANKARVAVGQWPSTLTGDGTHLNADGKEVYARATLAQLIENGLIDGTNTVPGAVQNLSASSGILTWDAPADDGGHPIRGYLVELNDGGWTELPPQGSYSHLDADGDEIYGKQYIREFDTSSHGTGTYRVSAITTKGTGAAVEVTVT